MSLRKTGTCEVCNQTLYGDDYGAAGHTCIQKHDGYVAWHPEKGYSGIELLKTEKDTLDRLCVYEGYYEDDDFIPGPTIPEEAIKDGWRIRPVKLTFLDEQTEEKKENE